MLFVRLFDLCLFGFSVSSSSWCLGRAAVCDWGIPWTFFLPFFDRVSEQIKKKKKKKKKKKSGSYNTSRNDLEGRFDLIKLPYLLYIFGQTGLSKQCRLISNAAERNVCSGSTLFATRSTFLTHLRVVNWTY